MLKRLLLIGTVCMFTIVMLQTDAKAISRGFVGWGAWPGSLYVNLEGEGPGNYDKWPGAITVSVWPTEASALCTNPQKKKYPNRQGTPFFWEGEIIQELPSWDWDKIKKNGSFDQTFTFTFAELFPGVEGCPEGACDTNPKWDCAYDDDGNPILVLTGFNIRLELLTVIEGYPDGFVDHEIEATCTLDDDLQSYTCTETLNVDWEWPNK